MKKPQPCKTKYCRGVATPSGRSPFCAKCRHRRWKIDHPLKYSYNKLKYRAKERGHEFSLTFDAYEKFAVESGYAALKGKDGTSMSIDRIDPKRGYHADNIRMVTLAHNSRLRFAPLPDYLRAEMEAEEAKGA